MGIVQDALHAVGLEEHVLYLQSIFTTGTFMVPREAFFTDLADLFRKDLEGALELGPGTARLMNTVVNDQKKIAKNGVYIGVDCNDESMDWVERRRPELVANPQVKLVRDFAQNAERRIRTILDGRKLQMIVVSIPHTCIPPEDIRKIWDMIIRLADQTARAILYNVCRTRKMMGERWENIDTYITRRAHFGLPMEFEVNVGDIPKKESGAGHLLNGEAHMNGKPRINGHDHLNGFLSSAHILSTGRTSHRILHPVKAA